MLTILQNLVSIMFFLIKCVSPDISYKVFIEDKTKENKKEMKIISGSSIQYKRATFGCALLFCLFYLFYLWCPLLLASL